ARLRLEPVGAAAEDVARQLKVVGYRIVTAQTELETVLAAGRAVAGALVATADVQDADQLVAEPYLFRFFAILSGDRSAGRLGTRFDGQGPRAVLRGKDETALGEDDDGIGADVAQGREVAQRAVGIAAGDDKLLHGARPAQRQGRRLDDKGRRLADQ